MDRQRWTVVLAAGWRRTRAARGVLLVLLLLAGIWAWPPGAWRATEDPSRATLPLTATPRPTRAVVVTGGGRGGVSPAGASPALPCWIEELDAGGGSYRAALTTVEDLCQR